MGKFRQYTLPEDLHVDVSRDEGSCEMIRKAPDGTVWMTYPSRNLILSLNSKTGAFTRYALPDNSEPDGLVIDSEGRVWFALSRSGNLGLIDPRLGPQVQEFPSHVLDGGHNIHIPGLSANGHVWITAHHKRAVYQFDPAQGRFLKAWPLEGQWPLDVTGDSDASVWVIMTNRLGSMDPHNSGSLARILYEEGRVEYHPVPVPGAWTYWISNDFQGALYVTAASKGFLKFDKATSQFTHYLREGGQYYMPLIASRKNGIVLLGNSQPLSIDLFDPRTESLQSFPLPVQSGQLKEGLDLDEEGNLWSCQNKTNTLFHLDLSESFRNFRLTLRR